MAEDRWGKIYFSVKLMTAPISLFRWLAAASVLLLMCLLATADASAETTRHRLERKTKKAFKRTAQASAKTAVVAGKVCVVAAGVAAYVVLNALADEDTELSLSLSRHAS